MTDFKVDGHSFRIRDDSIVATSHYTLSEAVAALVAREMMGREGLDGFTVERQRFPGRISRTLRGVVNTGEITSGIRHTRVTYKVEVSLHSPDSHFITFQNNSYNIRNRELEDGTFQIGSSEFTGILMRFREMAEGGK